MAKKPKLERTPLAALPEVPNLRAIHDLRDVDRCPRTGVVVGTRSVKTDTRGFSELYVVDPGMAPARLLHPEAGNYRSPSLSHDARFVAVTTAGPPGVLEFPLDGGAPRRIWEGGVLPDGYNVTQAVNCGPDHMVLFTGFQFALMRRGADRTLGFDSALGSTKEPIKAFSLTPALAGRALIAQHTAKATLVAVIGGVLQVVAELAAKKGGYLVVDDQVVERDAAGAMNILTIPA